MQMAELSFFATGKLSNHNILKSDEQNHNTTQHRRVRQKFAFQFANNKHTHSLCTHPFPRANTTPSGWVSWHSIPAKSYAYKYQYYYHGENIIIFFFCDCFIIHSTAPPLPQVPDSCSRNLLGFTSGSRKKGAAAAADGC